MTRQASSWTLVVLLSLMARAAPPDANLSFTIRDDRFVKDGKNFQIISGRYTLYTSAGYLLHMQPVVQLCDTVEHCAVLLERTGVWPAAFTIGGYTPSTGKTDCKGRAH